MARIKRVPDTNTHGQDASTSDTAAVSVAATEPVAPRKRRRRRVRTSSERSRAFRKRHDQQDATLEAQVERLRAEVHDKQYLLSVWEAKYLRTRHSVHSPLVAVTEEYFRMFQHGLRSLDDVVSHSAAGERIRLQESFVRSVVDPDVAIGLNLSGQEMFLHQWRLHTTAFPGFSIVILSPPCIIGPDRHPIVEVHVELRSRIGWEMLDVLFTPAVRAQAARLLDKHIGKPVQFASRTHLQFTRDNRLIRELTQVNYIESFTQAGLGTRETVSLLMLSSLTPDSTVQPKAPRVTSDTPQSAQVACVQHQCRHSLDFIL